MKRWEPGLGSPVLTLAAKSSLAVNTTEARKETRKQGVRPHFYMLTHAKLL